MKITEDPFGGHTVIVNTAAAVVPQHVEVALLEYADPSSSVVLALELEGPRTGGGVEARSDELYLFDADMASRLVALLIGIVSDRSPEDFKEAFFSALDARLEALRTGEDGGRQ